MYIYIYWQSHSLLCLLRMSIHNASINVAQVSETMLGRVWFFYRSTHQYIYKHICFFVDIERFLVSLFHIIFSYTCMYIYIYSYFNTLGSTYFVRELFGSKWRFIACMHRIDPGMAILVLQLDNWQPQSHWRHLVMGHAKIPPVMAWGCTNDHTSSTHS